MADGDAVFAASPPPVARAEPLRDAARRPFRDPSRGRGLRGDPGTAAANRRRVATEIGPERKTR